MSNRLMNNHIEHAISYRKLDVVKKLLKKNNTLVDYIVSESILDYFYLQEFKNLDKLFSLLPKWKIDQLMSSSFVCYLFEVTELRKVKELYEFIKKNDFNMCFPKPITFKGLTIMSFLDVFITVNCVGSVCSKFHTQVFDYLYKKTKGCYESEYFLNGVLFNIGIAKQQPLNIPFIRHIITKDMLKNKDNGFTHPLYSAIRLNHLEFLKMLVEKGADINLVNQSNSALNYALNIGAMEEIVMYLMEKGVDTQRTGLYFELPFQSMYISETYKKYSLELKKMLLSYVRDMNHQDTYGRTPAHYIMLYEDWRLFSDLLRNKQIDVDIVDKNNERVRSLLKDEERDDFIQQVGKHRTREEDVNISIPEAKFAKVNLSNATLVDLMFYIMFVLQKYPEITFPFLPSDKEPNLPKDIMGNRDMFIATKSPIATAYILKHIDGTVYVHPMLKQALLSLKTKYAFIYLDIISETTAHANCLIVDNVTKNIYHFEPNGRYAANGKNLNTFYDYLRKYFKSVNPEYTYNTPHDFLPNISFQQLADEGSFEFLKINDLVGYCLSWCFWFTELFLNNKNTDVKVLVEKAIKKMIRKEYFMKDFIRNYANNMFEKKIKFLVDIGLPENMVYNKVFPLHIDMFIVNKISEEIVKMLHKDK